MRNISFFLTKRQFLDGTKDVTRRLGWAKLKAGDVLMAVEKGQGLGKGGKVVKLGPIRIVKAGRTALCRITDDEAKREGFPELSGEEFVAMFCEHMNCGPTQVVTRIEFVRLPAED